MKKSKVLIISVYLLHNTTACNNILFTFLSTSLEDDAMFQKFIYLQTWLRKKGKKTENY